MQASVDDNGIHLIGHPLDTPNFAPFDFRLFPKINSKLLEGHLLYIIVYKDRTAQSTTCYYLLLSIKTALMIQLCICPCYNVAPNLCELELDDCDRENGFCIYQGADGFTCQCNEGYLTVDGAPVGRRCEGKVVVTYVFLKDGS